MLGRLRGVEQSWHSCGSARIRDLPPDGEHLRGVVEMKEEWRRSGEPEHHHNPDSPLKDVVVREQL
jgi:hypothetical protein